MQNNDILQTLANLIKNANHQNSISLDVGFNIFIEHSKPIVRPDTIKFYTKCYGVLKKALNQLNIDNTNQITKANYSRLINVLSHMNYCNATINKYTDTLKRIIKVLNDLEYINHNEIQGIKKLKETIPPIRTIDDDIVFKIENYLFNLPLSKSNIRNIVLILLFNDSGARLNEIKHILVKNINLENNSIYLEFTKTRKGRYVYFRDITKKYIIQLLQFLPDKPEYLFIDFRTNGMISNNPIYTFINKIKNDLKIDFSISPHKWRHTLATNLVNNNINVNEIMSVLGHTQFSTTRRYLHQANSKIKNDILNTLNKKK